MTGCYIPFQTPIRVHDRAKRSAKADIDTASEKTMKSRDRRHSLRGTDARSPSGTLNLARHRASYNRDDVR